MGPAVSLPYSKIPSPSLSFTLIEFTISQPIPLRIFRYFYPTYDSVTCNVLCLNSTIKVHEFLLVMCVLHGLVIQWCTETLWSFSLNFISIHLSLPSSSVQIFSSSPYARKPSVCVVPSMREGRIIRFVYRIWNL